MTEIVAVDLGGTHARFAIAEVEGGRVVRLGQECTLVAAEYAGLQTAWEAFRARLGRPLPPAAGIALAGPVRGEALKLTNNDWVIRPARIADELGVERYSLVNDFGAVAHAVAQLGDEHFSHLCGPERPLPGDESSAGRPVTGSDRPSLAGRRFQASRPNRHMDFAPLDGL